MKKRITEALYNVVKDQTLVLNSYHIILDGWNGSITDTEDYYYSKTFAIQLGFTKNGFTMYLTSGKIKAVYDYETPGYFIDNIEKVYNDIKEFCIKLIQEK